MTSLMKSPVVGFAALAALSVSTPVPLQAQSLDVTCAFGIDLPFGFGTIPTPLCDNTDMTEVETVVNQNEADIAANLATNNAQQTEIDANTSGVAANLATNNAQQTEIDVNTTNIAANAANIATNTADIATNAADIVDLQDGLADLRTDMNQGLAMANAMEVFAPDPGSNFRLNVGTGYNDGEVALGVTGSGRIGAAGSTIVYIGVAASENTTAGKAGVSFQW